MTISVRQTRHFDEMDGAYEDTQKIDGRHWRIYWTSNVTGALNFDTKAQCDQAIRAALTCDLPEGEAISYTVIEREKRNHWPSGW